MIKVAVIEDSAGMRRNLVRLLSRAPGVRCVCACETAEVAFEKVPANKPDVLLMDINLPGVSGIECTARLKEQLPSVQVIMLTVYEDTGTIFSALKAGACGYLLKSSSPAEILEAISEVCHGGAPMTSEIARRIVTTFQNPASRENETAALSSREREILELLSEGKASKEIADILAISYHTVRVHLKHIYEKLHVRSHAEALLKFISNKGALSAQSPPATSDPAGRPRR